MLQAGSDSRGELNVGLTKMLATTPEAHPHLMSREPEGRHERVRVRSADLPNCRSVVMSTMEKRAISEVEGADWNNLGQRKRRHLCGKFTTPELALTPLHD